METRDIKKYELTDAIVRICPACGVVNPSGPSGGCPHLQLIRFDGVDEEMEDLISDVAVARRRYFDLIATLKKEAVEKTREGGAFIETPRMASSSDADTFYANAKRENTLRLTHPEFPKPKDPKKATIPKKRKKVGAPSVDPRQLDLLALSQIKVDA